MREVRNRYVDVGPGRQLHCRVADGVGPTILFLHQTASSSRSYEALMRRLTVPNPLAAIDTPGFGGSFDPPGRPSMADYRDWVLQAADALGAQRMHVFGHHTGASLAIEIAALHPERTCSIMLAGPVLMNAAEREAFAGTHSEPIPLARDGSHLLVNWNYAAAYNPDCDLEILHGEVVAMLRARQGRAQAYGAVALRDAYPLIARIMAPVLLLTSPDDYFNATFDRAVAAFPGAQVATTGGGNFQPAADPAGVAEAISEFLAGLATAPVQD